MISRIKSLLSSLDLKQLDTRRIDLAMAWAQRHPLATASYNLGNYLFLGAVKAAQWAALATAGLKNRLRDGEVEISPPVPAADHPARVMPDKPRVLILAEDSIPQCFEYRVRQKLDMLNGLGWEAEWLPWPDIERVRRELHFFDVLVLYRVPGFDAVLSLIEYASSLNKLLIYDLDDLVFDRAQLEKKFSGNRGQLSARVYNELLSGADLYRKSMSLIPYCMVSTESLKEQVEATGGVSGFILPNGLSTTLLESCKSTFAEARPGEVIIFYGSGTSTHDADFSMVTPVLIELLDEYPEARLVIAGPLQLDPGLDRFGKRVESIGFLEYESFLEVLKCADINIAPLQPGVFADCKSEIKWLEAGMLGIPSVVSGTRTFRQAISQGETGFIADSSGDWKAILCDLITHQDLRLRIGSAARMEISRRYERPQLAADFRKIIRHCSDLSPGNRRPESEVAEKQRLLVVNTLYPPQSMGGATRIVKNLVDNLNSGYAGRYEIMVFTCDVHDTRPYYLREYIQDGVIVLSLAVPMRPDLEKLYEDAKVERIFDRLLHYFTPDIVHFHSVQRLTASALLATARKDIPYVVSLHDSWWISDYPFMIDDHGNMLPENISNPIVACGYSKDFNATADRNRYLRSRLQDAGALVAVSDYQKDLYSANGFDRTVSIENGVDLPSGFSRNQRQRLVLGYAGGKSEHKGYYFLKECISAARTENIEIALVDIFSKSDLTREESWGTAPVVVYPRFDFTNIGAFYSLIDVMVVPSMWPESFGLVAREASLLGLWVVAANSGGLRCAVIEGTTGFSYPQGDHSALQRIIAELDQNWSRYKQPVDQASVDKLGINTVEKNTRETHELYQRLLAKNAIPDS